MRLAFKTTALAIPSILLTLLIGRVVAIEIYAAKFPESPVIERLRTDPLRVLSVDWL